MLYIKLAAENIKKNGKAYIPYISACVITVAMFYIIRSLSLNKGLWSYESGTTIIPQLMFFGAIVTGIFAAIFLFYINSFLMKSRKKEFGLYNVLGMGKGHISRVVAFETLYVAGISILLGIGAGIALDKLMYLTVSRIIGADIVLGFYVSFEAVINVLILFGIIFFLIMLNSVRQIGFSKPIELLMSGSRGEKEPKTKVTLTVLGVLCLGSGYIISITTTDVRDALEMFFFAVLLVIIGTYMLFTAGSVFLLKALKKNKGYYYKTKHFTSVSGMLYRMKKNAAGLANICILSTMVLVMLSTTSCLMIAAEITLNYNYPFDVSIQVFEAFGSGENSSDSLKQIESIMKILDENSGCVEVKGDYDYFGLHCDIEENTVDAGSYNMGFSTVMTVIAAEDYNKFSGSGITLKDNEIAVITSNYDYQYDTLKLFDKEYKVKVTSRNNVNSHVSFANTVTVVIVKDRDILLNISGDYGDFLDVGRDRSFLDHRIDFDITDRSLWVQTRDKIVKELEGVSSYSFVEDKEQARADYMSVYGGLFFLGVFLGLLFTMAAILIIYYKQISEGYEDKSRYEIMQNVGMSKSEVKASIHSQVLTVFFLPLIVAGIHSGFAFPIILRMIELTGFSGGWLLACCMGGCFVVYAVLYVVIYGVGARGYYRIVSA
ncbi:MAG: ABC transporter permease [Ruminococcaceae bacterium]|nr:ABC transporter permease [Oscillospiraceae bacterium]